MPSVRNQNRYGEDPRIAIGIWAWRLIPVFAIPVVIVFLITIGRIEDPRLPLSLKSAQEDWFVVEVLTGKRM